MNENDIFKGINQIGIVTQNLEKMINDYEKILKIGPFLILDRKDQIAIYNDKEIKFSTKTALARFGNIQIEINNVYKGETPHTDWIKKRGEGLHHLGIFTENIERSLIIAESRGIKPFFQGNTQGVRFVYLDTESMFGYIYEFIQLRKRKLSKII